MNSNPSDVAQDGMVQEGLREIYALATGPTSDDNWDRVEEICVALLQEGSTVSDTTSDYPPTQDGAPAPSRILHPLYGRCPDCKHVTELCQTTTKTWGEDPVIFQRCIERCGFWLVHPLANEGAGTL